MGQSKHPLARPFIALVVEDEPELRYMAGSLLEETDLEVAEAETGEQALSFLRKRAEEVAMMFVDVNLPGKLNGHRFSTRRRSFLALDSCGCDLQGYGPASYRPAPLGHFYSEALEGLGRSC